MALARNPTDRRGVVAHGVAGCARGDEKRAGLDRSVLRAHLARHDAHDGERDLLVRKVFPELRRRCRERQVELVDVDLRWGITEAEAEQGKVLPMMDKVSPSFLNC